MFFHAGCHIEAICAALNIKQSDLFVSPLPKKLKTRSSQKKIVATYDYLDEKGTLLYQSVRYEPKDFSQRRPDGKGGWYWNLRGVRPVLCRLPEVMKAKAVLILEGEKDVDAARSLGLPEGFAATCNPMGAEKWRQEYSPSLQGKPVVILPDADEAGQRHGHQIARSLSGKAAEIRWLTLPHGKDFSDWNDKNGTHEAFQRLLDEAPIYIPNEEEEEETLLPQGRGRHKPTMATQLIKLVEERGVDLFHTPEREGFADIPVDSHREIWAIRSNPFRQWLCGEYYKKIGGAVGGQAIQETINVLEFQALFAGAEHPAFIRVAGMGMRSPFTLISATKNVKPSALPLRDGRSSLVPRFGSGNRKGCSRSLRQHAAAL